MCAGGVVGYPVCMSSFMPGPHPLAGNNGLVNLLGLRHTTEV